VPDVLRAVLLDLLHALEKTTTNVMLGGGYGLFLKQEHLASTGATTLIPSDRWPEARSTNDIDLLLRPEIVARVEHMRRIRDALDRLGFEPIETARFYQFVKKLGEARSIKIDLLAGPLGEHGDPKYVKIDSRRIKPKPGVNLHAHRTDEAIAYDIDPVSVPVAGTRSDGQRARSEVAIPQAFSYAMMKLFAFRDRRDDAEKEFAQHHALDLYRIIAMLTETENLTVQELSARYRENQFVREASVVVSSFFGEPDRLGVLRMREHPLFTEKLDVRQFVTVLREIFPE
jgi:hypothetical protein